ncbi:MAG: rRNA adenine dimethyltransferase family protein, partial [Planctomycetota bacterium]|nr:rRNA adenine dimethyltransferase family protein [Planctomycetota bacterium]
MKVSELKRVLKERGLAPRNRLGQNFLIDPALLQSIVQDAGVQKGDRVLEVGPGAGALTEVLLSCGAEVFAVEIDAGLCGWLRERFSSEIEDGRLRLLEGDVLAKGEVFHPEVEKWWVQGPPPRIVSNLPYAISGPFLGRLPGRPSLGVHLLLQKEMAEKAAGRGGAGPLPFRIQLSFHATLGRRLPPEVFWPRPQVDSAFLVLEPRLDVPEPELQL